jgi:hypothetical protein
MSPWFRNGTSRGWNRRDGSRARTRTPSLIGRRGKILHASRVSTFSFESTSVCLLEYTFVLYMYIRIHAPIHYDTIVTIDNGTL